MRYVASWKDLILPILLGLDTGGTYTDAVLYDPKAGVVATAKSLTTKHDLSIGLKGAIAAVLPHLPDGVDATQIALVSMSTTLATNAIVEGHGAPICLIFWDTMQRPWSGPASSGRWAPIPWFSSRAAIKRPATSRGRSISTRFVPRRLNMRRKSRLLR